MNKKSIYNNKRGGFTLPEIIIALVVLGILVIGLWASLRDAPSDNEIKSTLTKDIEELYKGSQDYKLNDIASGRSFTGITAQKLANHISGNMKYDTTNGVIQSSALNGGCTYNVGSSETNHMRWELYVDCTNAATSGNWSNKQKLMAEQTIASKITQLTSTSSDLSSSLALGCTQTALPTTAYTASSTTTLGGVTLGGVTSDCNTINETTADGKVAIININ